VSGVLWLLRGLWRGVRSVLGTVSGQLADRPSGDFLSRHAEALRWSAPLEAEIRLMALVYPSSFCGKCVASPDYPHGRCSACLEKLGQLLDGARPPSNPSP
jgi:hypothetical protein